MENKIMNQPVSKELKEAASLMKNEMTNQAVIGELAETTLLHLGAKHSDDDWGERLYSLEISLQHALYRTKIKLVKEEN